MRFQHSTFGIAAFCLLLMLGARIEARPPMHPDVLVVVYAMADEQDRIGLAYHGVVSRAQVKRDLAALQAAGAALKSIKIVDAPSLVKGKRMTSVDAIAPHMFHLESGQFSLDPFMAAFRSYATFAVTVFTESEPTFKGSNYYTDSFVNVTLDQSPHALMYWITIKDSRFQHLKIPDLRSKLPVIPAAGVAQAAPNPATPMTRPKRGLKPAMFIALVAVTALGAGMAVYFSMARNA